MKKIMFIASLLVASLVMTGCMSNYKKPAPGKIQVVRGDDVRSSEIKDILCPNQKAEDVGFDVTVRSYHESGSRRYYLITTDEGAGDRPGPDQVPVQTADGMTVYVEGEFAFNTNFDCSKDGKELLREFDQQYGNRAYPILGKGDGTDAGPSAKVWQGTDGWLAFLDINFRRKAVDGAIREVMQTYTCAQLNPACAAVENGQTGSTLADPEQGRRALELRQKLEEEIVTLVNEKLEEALGNEYFTVTHFEISYINLPTNVQKAVDASQAAYAGLAETRANIERQRITAQGELANARIEAERQRIESQVYATNPALLQLEIAKALAGGTATVYYGIQPTGVR